MPTEDEVAVRAAVNQWFVVLNAMLNGDPEPLAALYSHKDDVTYMSAEGTYRTGLGRDLCRLAGAGRQKQRRVG